ncbi:MAG: SMP-30/gluconolactonase/LRE family protein [Planctomycetota bacterium]|nr:MAG: SMP-30/gluconolactonase/LRE family protein [Planctomycetota bacterium]
MPLRLAILPILAIAATSLTPSLLQAEPHPVPNFKPTAQESIVPVDAEVELVWNEGEFTEGPAPMGDGSILFSDIGNRIFRYDPQSGETTVFRDPSGRSNGLMFDPHGRLVAAEGANTGGGRRISITDLDGKVRTLADSFEGKRFNSPNDLAITTDGDVYFSDPRYVGDEPRELDFEAVFLVKANGIVKVATREVEKPNGILVSPDRKTVYVADNNSKLPGAHQLLSFRIASDGTLTSKRVLFDFGAERRGIDGMTLDERGNIYATAGRGDEAGIYVFNPEGIQLAFIPTPGGPTNCVFGIGDEKRTLYITAAGPANDAGEPRFGLYRVNLKIPGYHLYPRVMP